MVQKSILLVEWYVLPNCLVQMIYPISISLAHQTHQACLQCRYLLLCRTATSRIYSRIYSSYKYFHCSFIGIQLLIISQTVSPLTWITRWWVLTGSCRQQGIGTRVGFFLSTLMSSESETCLISFKVFFFLFYSSNFTHLILRFTTSGTTMVSKIPDYSDSPPLLSLYKLPACCFACCFGTRTLLDSDNFCVCLLIYFLDGCIFLSLLFLLYLLDWNIKFVHIW